MCRSRGGGGQPSSGLDVEEFLLHNVMCGAGRKWMGTMSVHRQDRFLGVPGFVAAMGVVLAFGLWSRSLSAHHSFNPQETSDGQQVHQVLHGTVRVFRVLNPHGALIIDARNANGETEGWLFELSPAAQLAREGWTEEMVQPGDEVTVAAMLSMTPNRARLRALQIHGKTADEPSRLLVSYGIRGDTPTMIRLRERLPTCGTIDQSYNRTECFLIDADAQAALDAEFPGDMAYVLP